MLKLYMILVGFKPEGFITEQHDIVFALGLSIADPRIHAKILKQLPIPAGTKVHIDAWIEVAYVGGYRITVKEGLRPASAGVLDLYFANLGGYKKGDFIEHHKKLLFVVSDSSEVKLAAERDIFYRQMDFIPHARPHIDDRGRLNAEVEDELRVTDVLEGYHLVFDPESEKADSLKHPVIEGYMKIGMKPETPPEAYSFDHAMAEFIRKDFEINGPGYFHSSLIFKPEYIKGCEESMKLKK